MEQKQRRRRGAALEQAILDAAWAEISAKGWSGFTIEGVAARAGAAKTVIYRRWPNRVHLAQDMLDRATASAGAEPTSLSGDLREDLLSFLRDMAAFLRGTFGEAVRGVICEGDPTARPSLLTGPAIILRVREIVDDAVRRGELSDEPTAIALNLGHGMVMSEFLHTGSPGTDEGLVALVDEIWLPALRSVNRA